jgi:hypothetical protein
MDKQDALAALVALRRTEESTEHYFALHGFQDGMWDFDYVVPWTKSASNVDAKLMIIGQDWASEQSLKDLRHNTPERVASRQQLGHDTHLPTNRNLKEWLGFFDLTWEQTYATNVSVFIKQGGISAKVEMSLLESCAEKYTVPQIRIVKPLMAICLGADTFNSVRGALGKPRIRLRDAIKLNEYVVENETEIYGVPHAGGLGMASFGGRASVEHIWRQLATRFRQLDAATK